MSDSAAIGGWHVLLSHCSSAIFCGCCIFAALLPDQNQWLRQHCMMCHCMTLSAHLCEGMLPFRLRVRGALTEIWLR